LLLINSTEQNLSVGENSARLSKINKKKSETGETTWQKKMNAVKTKVSKLFLIIEKFIADSRD